MTTTFRVFFSTLTISTLLACQKTEETPTKNRNSAAMIYAGVHDPAQLVEVNNELILFASAVEWSSYTFGSDEWELLGDDIYADGNPDWYEGFSLWAPSIIPHNSNELRLYHSAVTYEENHQSRIGFATVNTASSDFSFTPSSDYVLESTSLEEPFAIDPAVFKDDCDRYWLIYGSHAEGVWMVELDENTGLLKENPDDKIWSPTDERFTEIANYGGDLDENNVEAAYIYNHPENPYYYLFVNWDVCCSGVNSTYNIRVGRSDSPTGPFLDKDGNDLRLGGGSLFMDANGDVAGDDRFIGPGHSGVYRHWDGNYYFSHHFYDGDNNGEPSLAVWNLDWADGWPVLNFQEDVNL